jgi:hypothetical protein
MTGVSQYSNHSAEWLISVRFPTHSVPMHRGAGKSLARLPSRCILFDGENISFDASLVLHT